MYTQHTNCRACGFGPSHLTPFGTTPTERLKPVFSLGVQPLANDFCGTTQERAGFAPLEVLLCPNCGLAQLSVVVNPSVLYANYPYHTSSSAMMLEHFDRLWKDVCKMASGKTMIEIGSNDGAFLKFCSEHGAECVLGIDPAENLVKISRDRGMPTICDSFTEEAANLARQSIPYPAIIVARHVFCHVDNWTQFMSNLSILAGPDTIIAIEVPYVGDLLAQGQFDTIYHEHLSYLSIRAMKELLTGGPFHFRKILGYKIHGGAIVMMIQRRRDDVTIDESVDDYLNREAITSDSWKDFDERSRSEIRSLSSYVRTLVQNGKTVAGYGASAKSTVWINACEFTNREIQYVTDTTPDKQYRYVPGTTIPVVNPEILTRDRPDYAILFAWNYAAEVLSRESELIKAGTKFIVPVPELRVIGLDSLPPGE